MSKKLVYFFIFLVINFVSLAMGSWLMDNGPRTEWYANLNRAPWEPPGWVFGFAWSLIMLCFSWYLAELFSNRASRFLWLLYGFQVMLNVSWNWLFFNQHFLGMSLLVIVLLTLVIAYYLITFRNDNLQNAKYLLLPYLIWLCLATSLNAYIVIYN